MYQFMQIYGNCTAVHCLGPNRIKGPVDNVQTKNYKVIELLLTNKYFDYIKNASFTQTSRPAGFKGDSNIAYSTDIIRIVHNNPTTQKYLDNLKIRCENFNAFINNLDSSKFLVYAINIYDIKEDHTLRGKNLITNIEYLKKKGLLNKVIFVGSRGKSWSNFWSNELSPIIKKYNLKYIEMTGIKAMKDATPEYFEKLYKQFYAKAETAIKTAGQPKSKAKKKEIKKVDNQPYLYF